MDEDIKFDDILKNGAEWGNDLLLGLIGRELNDCDFRLKALISIKIPVIRESRVDDLLKFLNYEKERRERR